jgi:hypothetical protein
MDSLTSILDLLFKLAPYGQALLDKLAPYGQDILEITASLVVGLYLNGTRLSTIYNIVNRAKLKTEPGKEKILAEKLELEAIEEKILTGRSQSELVEVCEKLACFQTFENYLKTFEYFGKRMEGTHSLKKADRIDVTYFVDDREMSNSEKTAERNYFAKQEYCIENGNLNVRRILLIKNLSDYQKMEEQLINLLDSPRFGLGVYILADNINAEGVEVMGDFKKHLNFNFMVIDGEEFCFGNGNRGDENEKRLSSSIMHTKLAEEMKKHIDYLWDHSLQVQILEQDKKKSGIFTAIEQQCKKRSEILTTIEQQCKVRNIIPMDYVSRLP